MSRSSATVRPAARARSCLCCLRAGHSPRRTGPAVGFDPRRVGRRGPAHGRGVCARHGDTDRFGGPRPPQAATTRARGVRRRPPALGAPRADGARAPPRRRRRAGVAHHRWVPVHAHERRADGEHAWSVDRDRAARQRAPAQCRCGSDGDRVWAASRLRLVIDHRPAAINGDAAVLMDWRQPGTGNAAAPTFLYVLPLAAGRWLVEETSLRSVLPVGRDELRTHDWPLASVPTSRIVQSTSSASGCRDPGGPVGVTRPDRRVRSTRARYVHPATGYSVAVSLRAADHVPRRRSRPRSPMRCRRRAWRWAAWNAVWPAAQRTARALAMWARRRSVASRRTSWSTSSTRSSPCRPKGGRTTCASMRRRPPQRRRCGRCSASAPWALRRRMAASLPVPLLRRR